MTDWFQQTTARPRLKWARDLFVPESTCVVISFPYLPFSLIFQAWNQELRSLLPLRRIDIAHSGETWLYNFNGLLNDGCIQFYDCYTCQTEGPHTSALLFFYILSFLVMLLFLIEIFLWNVSVLNIHSINDQCPGWDLTSLPLLFSGPIHGDFCPFWYKSISLTNLIGLEFPQIAI